MLELSPASSLELESSELLERELVDELDASTSADPSELDASGAELDELATRPAEVSELDELDELDDAPW